MMRVGWIIWLSLMTVSVSAQETQDAGDNGAPLTKAEVSSFQSQIRPCWNVGSQSKVNAGQAVTVAFKMARDGKPVIGSLQLKGFAKPYPAQQRAAFVAAKRAIIRCGAAGYKLPLEKFDQWKNIEITFDPERMLLK